MVWPRARHLPWLLVPVALGAIGVVRAWPVDARSERVERADVVAEVLGVGVLESAREVHVAFEVSGRVTFLRVDEGERVAEGDVLGMIDASDAKRDLAVSVAAERAASAAVARARAEVERARAVSLRAGADRRRADSLSVGDVISVSAHEAAIERDATATAEVAALEAALAQATQNQQVAVQTRTIRAAQVVDGELRSPLSGLVVSRPVEAGQLVTPGTPAFTIVSTDAMRVSAWVDETALGRLAIGQPARLIFRSEGDRSFEGRVQRIGREVDRQTHELLVDVTVLELPTNFATGQRADAWIEVGRLPSAVSVPRGWCGAPIGTQPTACSVMEDGRVATRAVTLGLTGRDRVAVLTGLEPGDVVLEPGAAVGGRVRAVEAP